MGPRLTVWCCFWFLGNYFVLLACQQKLKHNRSAKILALVPRSHALSDTSDISDTEIEHEVHERISSSPPSLDSSFDRLHLLSSPDCENHDDVETIQQKSNNIFEDVPLTPVMEVVCPENREPNYFDIPSISSIPSLRSVTATPTARPPKTRSRTKIAPVAKRPKKMKKFTLDYKWARAVFQHRATIQESELESECLDHFYKFFSPEIITFIVEQTNIYSVQQTGKSIQLCDVEFRDFLAIQIIMGIVAMPSYIDFWSCNFRYGLVADLMSLKRYQQIRRFLHFADNTLEDGDRYYKVRPVLEKIKENYLKFETERKFSIDDKIKKPRSARPSSPIRFDNVGHFISTKEDMGRCKYCNKNTTVYCIKCNIRLCFVTGKIPRNCFLSFHTRN